MKNSDWRHKFCCTCFRDCSRAIFYGNKTAISYITPVGDIFIHLIKMIVVPIVISALIVAVAGVGDMKKLGKLGGKTILYFEIITTIAILMGLLAANIFQPGTGVDMNNLQQSDISSYKQTADATEKQGFAETIVHIVPKTYLNRLHKVTYYRLFSSQYYSV